MESATVERTATEAATGAKTLADLFPAAVRKHGAKRAVVYKDDSGVWVSKTYAEVGEIVRKLSLGLMDLGIEKGDKVAILSNTRPEWTYFDFAALSAGATVVPIYQTNSPEECQYVLENSDAVAVVVEDDEQLEKIRRVRDQCPKLEHVILMNGKSGDAISLDALAERGASGTDADWEQRYNSVGPDDICTFIYTSGTTGPPKGCVISHGNYRSMLDDGSRGQRARLRRGHLPVSAARALVRAADPVRHLRPRGDARLLGARPAQDPPQPLRGEADLLPVGAADLREDLHRGDGGGRQGGRAQEDRLRLGDRDRQEGPQARARGQAPRPAARLAALDRRQAGAVEDPGAVRRQPEARRHRRGADQPRDPASSSTPPGSSSSRAGG